MKRHESRNISRSRTATQRMNPCKLFSHCGGANPFDMVLNSSIQDPIKRLQSEQKRIKARKTRKRLQHQKKV